jgi:predicted nuclease with RNAse H fold
LIWASVDFGARHAGTTAICFPVNQELHVLQSLPKQDVDEWLPSQIEKIGAQLIGIDAPLSLPLIYSNPEAGDSYVYRKSDELLRAMSPMFIGGLTARAMRLKANWVKKGIDCIEIYPSAVADFLDIKSLGYKKKEIQPNELLPAVLNRLPNYTLVSPISNWHQFDALLGAVSILRYMQHEHISYGNPAEGQIVV